MTTVIDIANSLLRMAASSKVRDNLWKYMNDDNDRNRTAIGGYTPSRGVFPHREMQRQYDEIKKVGKEVRDDFHIDHANQAKGGSRASFWVTFKDNRDKAKWQNAMDSLSTRLKTIGYEGVVGRNEVPVNENLVDEAESLYDEYVQELHSKREKTSR